MSIPHEVAGDAKWAMTTLTKRRPAYRLARRYYDGDHRLAFATQRFRSAFGGLFSEFADNLCEAVVDTLLDRAKVIGFDDGDGDTRRGQATAAQALWEMERLGLVSKTVHNEATVCGDSYVIVWPRAGGIGPVMHAQLAEECIVRYDPDEPGAVRFAAKWWRDEDTDHGRLTLYYPDRLLRFRTNNPVRLGTELPGKASAYTLIPDGDPDGPGVVPHGWGEVPVVHFAYGGGIGRLGKSRLKSVVPLNDMLNKAVLDAAVGAEFMALPQRWATGLEPRRDPLTGEELAPVPGADRLWSTKKPDAAFGQFAAADLTKLIEVQNAHRAEIARVGGIPAHLLMLDARGTPPSGRALEVAEARLVAKVGDCQEAWGPQWARVMDLGMRMSMEPLGRPLTTLWASAESQSDREMAETGEIKRSIGVSTRQVLTEQGYTDEQIDQMLSDAEDERRRQMDHGAVP